MSKGFIYPDPPQAVDYDVCVHCGMCLEACPTYLELSQEHQSPRGRVQLIKLAAEGKIDLSEGFRDPIDTCLDCRACETACPSGVPVGRLIETARGQYFNAHPPKGFHGWVQQFLLRGVIGRPKRLDRLASLMRFYQRSGLQAFVRASRLTRLLPKTLRDMEQVLPNVQLGVRKRYGGQSLMTKFHASPSVSSHDDTAMHQTNDQTKTVKRVGVFTGCVMDVFFADVNEETLEVLTVNQYTPVVPAAQKCCGALHVHAGDREYAKELARTNIDVFLNEGVEAIVVNAAGCGAALKEYGELLHDDPHYREKAIIFSRKVKDISEFLVTHGYRPPKAALETRVVYHDACHLAHAQGVREQPRRLLRSIPGLELQEMPESDHCCGSAGIYNLTHPDMADRLLERKISHIPEPVDAVAMGNPGCMLQIAQGMVRSDKHGRVVHTVSLLAEAYRKEKTQEEMG